MGFVLSILYFVTYYLTPATVFGPLAAYRIELILAALVLFVSLPALSGSFILKTPQSLALIGLMFAVFLSIAIGMHWFGGAVQAILAFIPNAFAYFLVCVHCNSKKKLQVIVLMMLFVCLFVIGQGFTELQQGFVSQSSATDPPYLEGMANDAGDRFYRLRGQGEINDPNDFAQLVVCVIPLMFIFWRPKKMLQNIVFVLLPVGALLSGAYLTHSRGSMLAILAMVIVAARRRIGTVPSLLLAGGLFAAASALHFTGGREISASAGSDRTALWGEGLQLLKSHPFFGIGYENMADEAGLTAHNSLVVCSAELGLLGLYFWSLFLFPTVRDALVTASPEKVGEGEPATTIIPAGRPLSEMIRKVEVIDKVEINRLGRLVVLSLTGFLVAAWFLSRALVLTVFLLGGIAEAIFEMALQRGMISPRMATTRVLAHAGGLAISLLLLMYILLRVVNVMH
jgi:hypothetical protein